MSEKRLKELTIKNSFMFGAVMTEPDNCKGFLERALEIPIEQVEVCREKSMVYHPEYKGIRLDVYAKDENHTHYNVEMQVARKPALGKRSRYYQSQIDMELLLSGEDYEELPDTYVIFICDFDPFGKKRYRYIFQETCRETEEAHLEDGRYLMFLSTQGENTGEIPAELMAFLNFVKADLKESEGDFHDSYVKQLQKSVQRIKESREMEERFMILEEMLKEKHSEGFAEGKVQGLSEGRKQGHTEGRREGILQGKDQKLLEQIKKKMKKNKTAEEIAEELEENEEAIVQMMKALKKESRAKS